MERAGSACTQGWAHRDAKPGRGPEGDPVDHLGLRSGLADSVGGRPRAAAGATRGELEFEVGKSQEAHREDTGWKSEGVPQGSADEGTRSEATSGGPQASLSWAKRTRPEAAGGGRAGDGEHAPQLAGVKAGATQETPQQEHFLGSLSSR